MDAPRPNRRFRLPRKRGRDLTMPSGTQTPRRPRGHQDPESHAITDHRPISLVAESLSDVTSRG
ncbi:hypothetical protein D623_10019239 [Myotis brandtii]|uniref:Uncharacterized protein n=1 Tax=Myotis brandtii TaxID=109478 RepID=S7PZB8_MYOBR|nr:hypothetical protein D623_10019239 [Myotis brandtii]